MDKQKQIEEMAKLMCGIQKACRDCKYHYDMYFSEVRKCTSVEYAEKLYNAGYRKQSEAEWIYHECVSSYDGIKSGYSCSRCNAFVDEDVFDADEFHKVYCGNCGAKMKGE